MLPAVDETLSRPTVGAFTRKRIVVPAAGQHRDRLATIRGATCVSKSKERRDRRRLKLHRPSMAGTRSGGGGHHPPRDVPKQVPKPRAWGASWKRGLGDVDVTGEARLGKTSGPRSC